MVFYINRPAGAIPDQYETFGVCLSCQTEQHASHGPAERPPYECRECGEPAVYPWLYCYDSNTLFVPPLIRDEEGVPRIPPFPHSPVTGGDNFGTYVPDTPGMDPENRHPLPPWPPAN